MPTPEEREEMRLVVRCAEHFSAEHIADRQASHRLGFRQRQQRMGYFYVHPELPGVCFDRRIDAARAAIRAGQDCIDRITGVSPQAAA